MKTISLGTIKLGDKVRISDPCYSMDVWCAGTVDNVLEGEYICSAEVLSDDETRGWGTRVSRLTAVRKDSVPEFWADSDITVGVDSGQCGIYDLSYFEQVQPTKEWYRRVCDITLRSQSGIVDNSGVVSDSGYGDGSYCCMLAVDKNYKVVGFEIIYII